MTDRPWMPFFVGDYLRDTSHLTAKEHGTYLLLILHYWNHGGLPDSDAALRKICKASSYEWPKLKHEIFHFFQHPGWRHKRIDKELKKVYEIRLKRQISGQKGAWKTNAKWQMNGRHLPENKARQLPGKKAANALVSHKVSKKEESKKERCLEATADLEAVLQKKGWTALPPKSL